MDFDTWWEQLEIFISEGAWSSANIKELSYEKGYRSCAEEKDAEIDELEQFCINIYLSLSVSELHKVTEPVEEAWHKGQKLWLRNTKHKGE